MRLALALVGLLAAACVPMAGSPCSTVCDCVGAPAPIKCPGAFSCTNKVCTYACSATCGSDDAGCPDGGTCTSGLCVGPKLICEG